MHVNFHVNAYKIHMQRMNDISVYHMVSHGEHKITENRKRAKNKGKSKQYNKILI